MDDILRREERIVLRLRGLYAAMGYRPYKMGKFEEYDFYAENRRFLESGSIITFTDTTGRLMALKPDVTLSIARGAAARPGGTLKVYYDESVYRAPDVDAGFQEITQTGLECIGAVDAYAMGEVVMLAVESLRAISPAFALDVSDMGYVLALLPELGLGADQSAAALRALGARNVPELGAILRSAGAPEALSGLFCRLAALYGPLEELLSELAAAAVNEGMRAACASLEGVAEVLRGFGSPDGVRLDLSLTGDMEYYNGLVFKGYVEGVPSAVLSGGRYDALMRKLGREAGAIGFAVYMNLLENAVDGGPGCDADVLLLYGGGERPEAIAAAAEEIRASGRSVRVQREGEGACRCRETRHVSGEGVPDNA